LMWLLLLVGAASCRSAEDDASTAAKPAASLDHVAGKSVLLVSVDTTRADFLACYGHATSQTPNIDQLAAEGTQFNWCMSAAPSTLPSHASLLTGTYPHVHGARENGISALHKNNVLLAEIFHEAGYATHAEVATSVLNNVYGLDQGFDSYGDMLNTMRAAKPKQLDEQFDADIAALLDSDAAVDQIDSSPMHDSRKADEITDAGIALLKRVQDKPFFIFLHYYDPHIPHVAPRQFADRFADGYLAEIAYFDHEFGRLMAALKAQGLAEKTLVILTSDHGESRNQHGEPTHSYFLYDATQHVPLILWAPGRIPAGQIVNGQVRLIDVPATILEFAGLEPSKQNQGLSLWPFVENPAYDPKLPAYGDSMSAQLSFGFSMLRFLRHDGWKYIHAPVAELYHVEQDRLEMFNRAADHPDRVKSLRRMMHDIIEESPDPPGGRFTTKTMTDEEKQIMQQLGYLTGDADINEHELASTTELDAFEPTGPNPADHTETIQLLSRGVGAKISGRPVDAEKCFRRLLELHPDNARATRELGDALCGQTRFNEALEVYKQARVLSPEDARPAAAIASLLSMRGDYDEAAKVFRDALELDPTNVAANLGMASLLSSQQKFDDAFSHFEQAYRRGSQIPEIVFKWGMALWLSGQREPAVEKLREAVARNPDNAQSRQALAILLHQLGKLDDAVQVLLPVYHNHPDD
ncbi:MAG: tetratricopeptide repeat protein, partial [Phycisphaerae bacterium]